MYIFRLSISIFAFWIVFLTFMKIRPLREVLYLSLSYLHQIKHVGYPSGWIAIKGDDKFLLSDILDEQVLQVSS